MYASRNKSWLRQCVPDGFLVGSTMILKPMQFGYSIGIALGSYSAKSMRRVHGFACFSLNGRNHIPLLHHEYFWENIHIDDLESIISSVQRSLSNFEERFGTLKGSARANLEYLNTWNSMNALFDVVQAHYLDPLSPLPKFPLTEWSMRQKVTVELPYQEELLKYALTLAEEWKRSDFPEKRIKRVKEWVTKYKVDPAIYSL